MTHTNSATPQEDFPPPQNWPAQPYLPPDGLAYTRLAETMGSIAQAQIAYGQSLFRANANFLAALLGGFPTGERAGPERPSQAAHRPDVSAP